MALDLQLHFPDEAEKRLEDLKVVTGGETDSIIQNALRLYEVIVMLSVDDWKFYKQNGNRAIEPFQIFGSPGDADAES